MFLLVSRGPCYFPFCSANDAVKCWQSQDLSGKIHVKPHSHGQCIFEDNLVSNLVWSNHGCLQPQPPGIMPQKLELHYTCHWLNLWQFGVTKIMTTVTHRHCHSQFIWMDKICDCPTLCLLTMAASNLSQLALHLNNSEPHSKFFIMQHQRSFSLSPALQKKIVLLQNHLWWCNVVIA